MMAFKLWRCFKIVVWRNFQHWLMTMVERLLETLGIEEFLTNFPFILLLNLGISRVKMMREGMCGSCYCCSGLGLVQIVVRS
jgi:hypothetical protein